MAFTKINTEGHISLNGYEYDSQCDRIIDNEVFEEARTLCGEMFVENMKDDLFEGFEPICKGDDGNIYTVKFWGDRPVMWQRLKKIEVKNEKDGDIKTLSSLINQGNKDVEASKTMKKYELWKETQIEMRRRPVDYTVADLEKFSLNRTSTYHEPIAQYDTMEEARAAFEDEKQYCRTYSTGGLILFDELRLMEVNYDDDGEFEGAECWDNYIEDDKCLIFG